MKSRVALFIILLITFAAHGRDTITTAPEPSVSPLPIGTFGALPRAVSPINNAELVYRPMIEEIASFWSQQYEQQFPETGSSSARIEFLTGGHSVTCTHNNTTITFTGDDGAGPVYCFAQDTIVVPVSFITDLVQGRPVYMNGQLRQLQKPVKNPGVFFLLAHEWGHNVQSELFGLDVLSYPKSAIENHADCLAGVALAGSRRIFNPDDLVAILHFVREIGEPRGLDHGKPADREAALLLGLERDYSHKLQINNGIIDCTMEYLPDIW